MQPDATAVLNGVKQIIFNILLPELQTEQARQQAMYTGLLLDHVIARWEIEGGLLLEERAELRALLTQALAVLGDGGELGPRVRAALEGAAGSGASPRAMDTANERMRTLVPALARALPQDGGERILELDAAMRAYIRNQHRRDQQIVQVGGLAW
ncbi:MAG: hypothetical protein HY699_15630 [Deltaproteobacteria bacterium]|nr:hypothetical protein [Deltaproteobacteria bacterium]